MIFSDWKWRIRFESEPPLPDVVRLVSIPPKAGRCKASLPIAIHEHEKWFVRVIGSKDRLVLGVDALTAPAAPPART